MKLLQSLENHIENQKIPLKNNIAKTIFSQRRKKLFEVTEAATGGVLKEKENSQENACARETPVPENR